MEIYLLRHGIAEDQMALGSDGERPLTPLGCKKMAKVARWLDEIGVAFDLILCSPLVRARQTAEVVARKMKYKGKVACTGNLRPGFEPNALVNELKKNASGGERLLLVGHEPDLSQFASWLLTGKTGLNLELKKGGICKLDLPNFRARPCAKLVWLLSPKALGI